MGKSDGITFHGDKGDAVRRSQRIPAVPGEEGVEPVIVKSSQQSQHGALGELPGVRQDAREAGGGHRDLPAFHHHLPARQRVAPRSKMRVDWDEKNWTVKQADAKKFLSREERRPWKLVV